jgi:glycerol-3-phosphate acyltransferase PlsY
VGLGSGLLAVVGHNWPVYLSFRGGRGVAATFGSVLALAPWAAVGAFVMAVLVVLRWRWVSLGSIVGSNLLTVGLLVYGALAKMPTWAALYGLVLGIMVTATHRDNIQRLLAGTERKLGDRVAQGPGEEGVRSEE